MKSYKVTGGNILVFGDLHLSSTYTGQHKDYTLECYNNMGSIAEKVKESKASAVFFLGDVIGVNERNIRDRQFLLRVMLFFKTLNEVTGGNVYSVKGNHDKGDFSDFDFLIGVGLLKNPNFVDYYNKDGDLEVRFHFVNYGEETRELNISDSSDVVLAHNNFLVDGVTTWYKDKNAVQLATLKNFIGVDLIVSGHIHNGSTEMVTSEIIGGDTVGLFYTGSPSRTSERVDDCWYFVFSYENGSTDYEALLFGLPKADEVFYPKESFVEDEDIDEVERKRMTEALTKTVKEIMECRLSGGDFFEQIRLVPNATDEAKELASKYLRKAIDLS